MTSRSLLLGIVLCLLPSVGARADQPAQAPSGSTAVLTAARPAPDIVPIVLLRRSSKKAPDGSGSDVLVPADPAKDALARRARAVVSDPRGFTQLALRLDRFAKNYLRGDPTTDARRRAVLDQPAFLFLSDRQGGFPAEHFWLEQPDGSLEEMRDVPFVDMVVDERDFAPGAVDGLEQIYAHELGHLIMASLAGPAPRKASSAMHFMTVRTDPWYAFTEGFGEHFQPMALDHYGSAASSATRNQAPSDSERFWYSRFAREETEGCWICPANLRLLWWQGRGEQRLRDAPLRENAFVHQLALPEGLRGDRRPAGEARMYRDVMPPAAGGPLKNASQMLSSEAVMATFFYRLASDARLRNSYREPPFYQAFLGEEHAADLARLGPAALISPAENVYLKAFDILHRRFEWSQAPAISFVSGWAAQFPDEAAAVYDVFLDVTRGVTVERAAFASHAAPGYLAGLRDRLLAGTGRIDGNLGRPLWMVSPGMSFGMGLYRYFLVPQSFTLDLNGADVADLRSVPGVSSAVAEAIVREREARGSFAAVGDLAGVPGVSKDLVARFASMHERMQERLKRPQQQMSNPTWFMNYVAMVIKGTYYAAGVWQFGRALVVAGLGYLLTMWLLGRLTGTGRIGGRRIGGRETSQSASGEVSRPPISGEVSRPRRLRRALWALSRGAVAASVPCAISVGLYSQGIFPTMVNMAGLGLVLGIGAAVLGTVGRTAGEANRALALSRAAAILVASVIIGGMY